MLFVVPVVLFDMLKAKQLACVSESGQKCPAARSLSLRRAWIEIVIVFGLRLGNIQARRAGACFRLGGHMVQFPLETSSLCCGKIVQKLLKKN